MSGGLIPLDDRPEIKELLIAFALYALNYERLIDQIRNLCLAISPAISDEERTGGGWINLADNLMTNNLQATEESRTIWGEIRKNLWEINQERIRILKGAKFYEIDRTQAGAKFVTLKNGVRPKGAKLLSAGEIYKAEQRSRDLELAVEQICKCVEQGVEIAQVISRVGERYAFNLHYLNP